MAAGSLAGRSGFVERTGNRTVAERLGSVAALARIPLINNHLHRPGPAHKPERSGVAERPGSAGYHAWSGHKSFKRKDNPGQHTPPDDPGNPSVDFHGERRSNLTHQSTTDPEARLARKGTGKEAKLSYAGHVLMENRNGIAVNGCVTQATGRAEPHAALAIVEGHPGWHRITLRAD